MAAPFCILRIGRCQARVVETIRFATVAASSARFERLCKDRYAGGNLDRLGVAGEDQDRNGRAVPADGVHQLDPGHPRHGEIGDHQIEVLRCQQVQRLAGVARLGLPITEAAQEGRGHVPDVGVVVHHEDTGGPRPGQRPSGPARRRSPRSRRSAAGAVRPAYLRRPYWRSASARSIAGQGRRPWPGRAPCPGPGTWW